MRKKAPAKAEKAEAKKIEKAQKLDKATLKSSKSKGKAAGQAPANAFALSALADGKKQVVLHSKYALDSAHPLYSRIEGLFQLLQKKESSKNKKLLEIVEYTYYPTFEFELQGLKPDHDKCCICQFEFENRDYEQELKEDKDEDIVQLKCGHILHIGCFRGLVGDNRWIRCPVCFTIFGVMMGDQPKGQMTWTIQKDTHCDGYPKAGTIVIDYEMSGGKKNGVQFYGTSRTAFLPNTPEGNEVLKLLKKAFDRKLIFTIGTSVTTGQQNCVVWNGIHHKSDTHGGSSCFGYPDPTYFDRVKLELAAKGVY